MPRRKVAIAGVAESRYGEVPDATALQLHQEAAALALADAGLRPGDVDGLFSCGADIMHPLILGEYLGLRPGYVDGTQVGGSSWEFFVHHAVGAIEAGLCDVALLNYATTSRSDLKRKIRSANVAIEARGPCAKGEGGAFVEGDRLAIDGELPTNTDGGGLSSNHPGMRGLFLIIEAARQLRGEANGRQVNGAKLAAVNGTGGWFSSTGTLILGVD